MDPITSWAAIAAGLLVTFTVIAETRGWLNDPTPQPHDDDTDKKDETP